MGREVKRVPIGFDWPLNKTWWGFLLDPVPCQTCDGSGKASKPIISGFQMSDGSWHSDKSEFCPTCEGDGKAYPRIEVPTGPGYQLWETTSEGSALSPSLATPEELARWLADNGASTFGGLTTTYETWLAFIKGPGHSFGLAINFDRNEMTSGVDAVVENEERKANETG